MFIAVVTSIIVLGYSISCIEQRDFLPLLMVAMVGSALLSLFTILHILLRLLGFVSEVDISVENLSYTFRVETVALVKHHEHVIHLFIDNNDFWNTLKIYDTM